MKIVVLDSYCVRPGDLDWSGLYDLADVVEEYPRTGYELLADHLRDADFAVSNKCRIDDAVLESVKIKGELIRDYIEGLHSPYVVTTRGLGLMIGVQVQGIGHKELAQKCIDEGLLVLTAGKDTLRMLPPLTISKEEIMKALEILRKVLCP